MASHTLSAAGLAKRVQSLGGQRADGRASGSAPESPLGSTGLSVSRVDKHWGKRQILREVELTVEPGALAWVGGRNGAGKTTLLRIVAGLLEADRGEVSLDGLSPKADRRRYQRQIGLLSAGDRGLYARLTVRQNLDLWARLSFVPRRECATTVGRAVTRFSLEELAEARADRLSLGQRQRVRLATAFLHSPRLVLLDEPANSLDDEGIALLCTALAEIGAGGGTGIWCSPRRPDVESISHGYTIDDGRLVASS
jgi:ABC-type multidrug transport system ATPase subunit